MGNRGVLDSEVSVVIPLFNHEDYIAAAIESVLNQIQKVGQIIVIDDGSTDDGFSIAKMALRNHPNSLLLQQKNMGTAKTLNRAITLAENQWIAILNSDDVFSETKILHNLKKVEENSSLELIFGQINFIDKFGSEIKEGIQVDWLERSLKFYLESGDLRLSLINENFSVTTSNFFFNKKLWENIGGFQDLRYCNDLDFLLRVITPHNTLFDENFVGLNYRIHELNTIKEEVESIRLERAIVIAFHLSKWDQDLKLDKTSVSEIHYIEKALKNLNLRDIVMIFKSLHSPSMQIEDFISECELISSQPKIKRMLSF